MVFSLGQILSISCFLTGIVMSVFVLAILLTMRFGQQWLSAIIERFTNPDRNKDKAKPAQREQTVAAPAQQQVASSQSLRQRAQSLDFPAPAGNFGTQAAPAYGQEQSGYQQAPRASFRARDQYPEFGAQGQQAAQQPQQNQGFQPTMPSLSPSRPFQGGGIPQPSSSSQYTQPSSYPQPSGYPQQGQQAGYPPQGQQGAYPQQQPLRPQQGGFQQQGLPPQQPQQGGYPQQQGNFQQGGVQPLRPQAPQPPQSFPQQGNFGQQLPPQGGFQQQPLRPQQGLPPPQPQQGGFQQQGLPPQQPQQGGLGEYRPQLSNAPRPDLRTQQQRPMRRDNRRSDESEEDGLLGAAGDLLDGAEDLLGF